MDKEYRKNQDELETNTISLSLPPLAYDHPLPFVADHEEVSPVGARRRGEERNREFTQ